MIFSRKMQGRTGHPSEATFRREVSQSSQRRLFNESPISARGVTNDQKIFGPSMPCKKGKWVRGRPEIVHPEYMTLPEQLVGLNKYVTIAADVMFVSGCHFWLLSPGGSDM